MSRLRLAIGLIGLAWQLSFTADLVRWFGPQGWLDPGVYERWVTVDLETWSGRLSFLFVDSPTWLWIVHFSSSLVLLGFAVGYRPRITSVLAWIVLLGYVHRAPFLGGVTELVLTMVVGYLALTPQLVAHRLIQVHLSAIYAVMVATKLLGAVWWDGEAIWWMNAQALAGGNLMFLREAPVILNLWTFGIVITELAMVTLVWNRHLRPLAIAASSLSWLSLSLITGQLGLSATMIVANMAFLDRAADKTTNPREN